MLELRNEPKASEPISCGRTNSSWGPAVPNESWCFILKKHCSAFVEELLKNTQQQDFSCGCTFRVKQYVQTILSRAFRMLHSWNNVQRNYISQGRIILTPLDNLWGYFKASPRVLSLLTGCFFLTNNLFPASSFLKLDVSKSQKIEHENVEQNILPKLDDLMREWKYR